MRVKLQTTEHCFAEPTAQQHNQTRYSASSPELTAPKTFIESLRLSESQMASLAAGDFLYLSFADKSNRKAYELKPASHSEIDGSRYFTLSRAGVTTFFGADSEFTTLEQWEREYRLYWKIRNMHDKNNFFQKFPKWKMFTIWRKRITGRKQVAAETVLQDGLFVLNDVLRTAMMRLRRLCFEVNKWGLFACDPQCTYTLEDFTAQQAEKRRHVGVWLSEFAVDVRALVRGACDTQLDRFLTSNKIKADHKMTFMERAALRAECRRLTKFVRVCDFIVADSLLSLALDSTATLRAALLPSDEEAPERIVRVDESKLDEELPNGIVGTPADIGTAGATAAVGGLRGVTSVERRAPLIRVTASFHAVDRFMDEDDAASSVDGTSGRDQGAAVDVDGDVRVAHEAVLSLDPPLHTARLKLGNVLNKALAVIASPPRLLTHPDLSPYTQAAADDGEPLPDPDDEDKDIATEVLQHAGYRAMEAEMWQGLDVAYAEVESFSSMYLPFAGTFLRNDAMVNSIDSKLHLDTSLEFVEAAISKYEDQVKAFAELPYCADIGIVRLDCVALKQRLTPSPQRVLTTMQEMLPYIMTQRANGLINRVSNFSKVLLSSPSEVEDFVAKVAVLEEAQEELPEMREHESHTRQLGSIMESAAWDVPAEVVALLRALRSAMTKLEGAVQSSEVSLSEDTRKFASRVENDIPVLRKSVLAVQERMDDPRVGNPDADINEVCEFVERARDDMASLRSQADKFKHYQIMLKQEPNEEEFNYIDDVSSFVSTKVQLWTTLRSFSEDVDKWRQASFASLNAEELDKQVQTYLKVASRTAHALPGNAAAVKLRGLVENFRGVLPVIMDLRSDALQPRHWVEIEAAIGQAMDPEHDYTLGELLEMGVSEKAAAIGVVATQAVQEAALLELFAKKVTSVWDEILFDVLRYKDQKDVFILGSVEEITVCLDESLVTINTILGSRFCAPIKGEVEVWQKKLMLLSDTLDEWLTCQKQWMYLENIFVADDIKRQLEEESKRFANVDRTWKAIMTRTSNNPKAIVAGTVKGTKEQLARANEILDSIQKSLEEYLETKRLAFPRFYFLSNEELLEILAQTRDPQAVQPHLRKCFDALTRLRFGDQAGSIDILAMQSPEKEEVLLPPNLKARGKVEEWLMAVQLGMIESLRQAMKLGVEDYLRTTNVDTMDNEERSIWVKSHPGQVVASVAQIMWSRGTEQALLRDDPVAALKSWFKTNLKSLGQLTQLVRGQLTKIERKIIVALVTTDVHARDIISSMCKAEVSDVGSFLWQQQLRYYWLPDVVDVQVKQSNAVIPYGFEYQGAASRLVITPLTDRCWMTITGAWNLKLGAAPAGPAGTGKTESSKDLAKALGIQCIVFNCSEQIDYKMIGKLFAGLAQAGAWTCLDEFNRIDIEVLSVVAQQLQQLRQGKLAGMTNIQFEGRSISLKDHVVIITMNPGYAGRTELPDNLKIQFRPVAMMVPDYALIAEIILYAEGFDDAQNLSRKMVKLYKLSSEQLSQQRHYDFGMRAVKSVLVMAGALKRGNPGLSEDVVLIRAMRDSNVPKFLADDLPLFHAIVGDLFPGVVVPAQDFGALQQAILAQLDSAGLQQVDKFIFKIIQLFETFNVRFGVVITGPTGAGKTRCYQTLAGALTSLRQAEHEDERFQEVTTYVLNPKCITMGELYGEMNELTQEWHDGLASTIMRSHTMLEDESKKWTVFDGPIDALWIENMNTVLDDNMTLCLANGERIKLKPQMRMLFEVQDLDQASPATVSRLGVVYMTPDDMGWMPYVQSWFPTGLPESMTEAHAEHLMHLFNATVSTTLDWQRKHATEPIVTTDLQLVASLCRLITSILRHESALAAVSARSDSLNTNVMDFAGRPQADMLAILDSVFAFALVWAIGGSMTHDSWLDFSGLVRGFEVFKLVRFGSSQNLFDVFPDISQKDVPWCRWIDVVPKFEYDVKQPYFAMVVPTVDTVRYTHLLNLNLEQLNPVFLTGVTGTGKTVIVQDFLNAASADEYTDGVPVLPIVVNFSAQTSAMRTQVTIESKLEKKKKTQLGAPTGKRVVVFVDDVNMPAVETYGAQPPVELLRQFTDFGGFYDREKLFWKDVVDTVLVVASAPPGGGRAEVTPRFSRHYHMLCMPPSSDEVLKSIFSGLLGGFLNAHPFPDQVRQCVPRAIQATINVYESICATMRPTPSKSHYTFNLRDVSKVVQGMLMIAPRDCPTPDVLAKLWAHESCRVFHDRLVSKEDKKWFTATVAELLSKVWTRSGAGWSQEELFEGAHPVLFANYLTPPIDDDTPPRYEMVTDWEKLQRTLKGALDDYNIINPNKMNLVFFRDAVEHLSRIARMLRQPRGNAMLIGVGGSGKQSLTRMACSLADMEVFTIELTRGYDLAAFREDMKGLMMRAGGEGRPIAFLFTDSQIVHEGFLEDINNMLNTGEIPSLFEQDEVNKVCEDVRPIAQAKGIPETRDNLYRLFVSQVRDNLHIILAMSPVGDSLRVRCRNFPSLINCCTIDWFMAWPRDALLSVAQRMLSSAKLTMKMEGEQKELSAEEAMAASKAANAADAEDPDAALKAKIADMCVDVHLSVAKYSDAFYEELQRKVYTTPKSYLDLLQLYLKMLSERQGILQAKRSTLANGVSKLEETNAVVADLQENLTANQPLLVAKSEEAAVLLEQVKVDKADAQVVREKVQAEEAIVREQAAEVGELQVDAEKDLAVALPALEAAVEALNALDKDKIREVRSFASPPPLVKMTMEAVCTLLGESADWDTGKRLMGMADFMDQLKDYDKDNIPQSILKKLRTKFTTKPEFAVDLVGRVSTAAKCLCMWCHAIDQYANVAKDVEPKKQRLAEMNAQLAAANATLAEKQANLKAVEDKVEALEAKATATENEKQRLADEQELTKKRLVAAEELTMLLGDEGVRWAENVSKLSQNIENLIGDVLLAAASVSYFGAFTGDFRTRIVSEWLEGARQREIPASADYSLVNTLTEPVHVREWMMTGLPSDAVSIDNAILVTRGERWPLVIDPQEQAKRWIKSMESSNRLAVTRMGHANLLRDLESCIRIGRPLLIEDMTEFMDPSLEPVLAKAVFTQHNRLLIHLGDSDVDYDPDFRMYMSTKLPNPHYLPEVCIKVTIINFTVTQSGLEDQLLGAVVYKERPDVEKRRDELITSMASDKKQLQDLEDRILQMLQETQSILDDTELIEALKESKAVAKVTNERLAESTKTEVEINTIREEYRSAAVRGALIYFVIADLARVDPMYQFSLAYFLRLFIRCIEDSKPDDNLTQRLKNLMDYLTAAVYANVCRGLFEAHKLIFSFLIAVQILRERGEVSTSEWLTLLRGAGMSTAPEDVPNPAPSVVSGPAWNLLFHLQSTMPESFSGLCDDITRQFAQEEESGARCAWHQWITCDEPHAEALPGVWHQQLSPLQRMLVLKAFREEKLMFAVKDFVIASLGKKYVLSPAANMADIYSDTDASTPVVFILSVGADPTGMLFSFAKQKNYTQRLKLISLGQGQGPRAQALIDNACLTGDWVLLQNCHLAKSWMPQLERIVDGLQDSAGNVASGVHPDFRLFLTSMPAPYFPVPVLQQGAKLTNEPPKGVVANLSRSLAQLDTWTAYDECEGVFQEDGSGCMQGQDKKPVWQRLAFGLCMFHALVQERRKFGPLGWNIFYEFNDSDLETSMQVLKQFLVEQPIIPWDALTYVTGEINYGGRVTDDLDRRCLMTILSQFYTPAVLKEGYTFSSAAEYRMPPAVSLDGLKHFVEELPLNDPPEIFGMHMNANIAFQARESESILRTCLSIQPKSAGGAGDGESSPDQVVAALATTIAEALPAQLKEDEAGPKTFIMRGEHMDSLATVLQQEMARFNLLLGAMEASLHELQRAIRGEVLMSDELDKMYSALLNNLVPDNWDAVAYPSLKPLASWVTDLHARIAFMRKWLVNGQPGVFWMSGFFFPQGFMTGTLQNHARKYSIAIDTLSFSFHILKPVLPQRIRSDEVPSDGVLINGLFLDGGRWDAEAHSVADPRPGEIYSLMPIIHFIPAVNYTCPPGDYSAPVYKTSVRAGTLSTTGMSTNLVMQVDLPSDQPPAHWIKAGTALLCQLND